MSVINTKYDDHSNVNECTVCGRFLHAHFPFLWWRGKNDICICAPCCQEIKNGFIADLIQITATRDILDLGLGYAVKLVRKRDEVLEAEGEKFEQEVLQTKAEIISIPKPRR
jgi:hypothetical protein